MKFRPGKPAFEAIAGSRRCSARSKQSGERCRQIAVSARTVCYWHGGRSPRGENHPAYEHGEATLEARARAVWWNAVGRAVMKLNRARTPAQKKAAAAFTYEVFAREPGRD